MLQFVFFLVPVVAGCAQGHFQLTALPDGWPFGAFFVDVGVKKELFGFLIVVMVDKSHGFEFFFLNAFVNFHAFDEIVNFSFPGDRIFLADLIISFLNELLNNFPFGWIALYSWIVVFLEFFECFHVVKMVKILGVDIGRFE